MFLNFSYFTPYACFRRKRKPKIFRFKNVMERGQEKMIDHSLLERNKKKSHLRSVTNKIFRKITL